MFFNLNGIKMDPLLSELLDLLLYKASFGVSIWIVIVIIIIFSAMARCVSYQNGVSCLRSPILLESFFKAPSNILRAITATKSSEFAYELLAISYVCIKREDFKGLLSIVNISVGYHRDSDLYVEELIPNAVHDREDLLFTGFDPAAHGASAIDDEHNVDCPVA